MGPGAESHRAHVSLSSVFLAHGGTSGTTDRFLLQQMAAVAELERGLISERTKAALARSKKKLGGFRGYVPSDRQEEGRYDEGRESRSA